MDTIFRIVLKKSNQNLQFLNRQPTSNASTMTSKMTAPEIYLLTCNFENVIETMGDTWQVEITSFK